MARSKEFSILIADDNEQNRLLLFDILHSLVPHADIQQAEDGEAAINDVTEKIKRTGTSVSLIFMDYQMPGIDGEKTTSKIRQIENEANLIDKSIIITWSTAKRAPYPKADDWLIKPPLKKDVEVLLSTYGFIDLTTK